jgi:hypothetical protein
MARFKTFDSTGVPPGGVLFAGDENAMQDRAAELANFSQTVDVGVLRVGEAAIQLVKFATGEARLTGLLRVDGILRGLGGLYAGTFTTAARDAIPLGSRPFGLMILNTTTARIEMNFGSDAVPLWQTFGNMELGYLERTTAGVLTINKAQAETPFIDLISMSSVTVDGRSVEVEFFCPWVKAGAAGSEVNIDLLIGGTVYGNMGRMGVGGGPVNVRRRFILTAGTYTFLIRVWRGPGVTNGELENGGGGNTGGNSILMPSYLRVSKSV